MKITKNNFPVELIVIAALLIIMKRLARTYAVLLTLIYLSVEREQTR